MRRAIILCLAIALEAAGCTTSQVEATRNMNTGIQMDGAVTVVSGSGDDPDIPVCVGRALRLADPEVSIIPSEQFRDALFPWFERRQMPSDPQQMAALLEKALIQRRIKAFDLRYLIVVSSDTKQSDVKHAMILVPGGFFGFESWDREASLTAVVWDLKEAQRAGTVDVSASGTALVPAFILPIPLIPATETTACQQLGRHLAQFLTGADMQ